MTITDHLITRLPEICVAMIAGVAMLALWLCRPSHEACQPVPDEPFIWTAQNVAPGRFLVMERLPDDDATTESLWHLGLVIDCLKESAGNVFALTNLSTGIVSAILPADGMAALLNTMRLLPCRDLAEAIDLAVLRTRGIQL